MLAPAIAMHGVQESVYKSQCQCTRVSVQESVSVYKSQCTRVSVQESVSVYKSQCTRVSVSVQESVYKSQCTRVSVSVQVSVYKSQLKNSLHQFGCVLNTCCYLVITLCTYSSDNPFTLFVNANPLRSLDCKRHADTQRNSITESLSYTSCGPQWCLTRASAKL